MQRRGSVGQASTSHLQPGTTPCGCRHFPCSWGGSGGRAPGVGPHPTQQQRGTARAPHSSCGERLGTPHSSGVGPLGSAFIPRSSSGAAPSPRGPRTRRTRGSPAVPSGAPHSLLLGLGEVLQPLVDLLRRHVGSRKRRRTQGRRCGYGGPEGSARAGGTAQSADGADSMPNPPPAARAPGRP